MIRGAFLSVMCLGGIVFCVLILAGCGAADPPAIELSGLAEPSPVPDPDDTPYVPRPESSLTFTKDIAPIVFGHCVLCHRPGQSAPFNLLTYEDVRNRAKQIAIVTESRFMPPWLPEPGYGDFAGQRRLSLDQIGVIAQWAGEGAREGDPSDLPAHPQWAEGWQLGEPDLIVEMPETYTLKADGEDVFREFVIPLPVDSRRYVRSVELRPGNKRAVHHALMQIDRTRASRRLDEMDPEAGFDGMVARGAAQFPNGHFLGWTPGRVPFRGRDDMAWTLEKGSDLVVLMHMVPTGKPEKIRAAVGLFFADKPPEKTPFMLRLGSKTIDIPPDVEDYLIEDSFELPVDVTVVGVYPHAHYLAKDMKGFATLPDGTTRWLIRIEDWDFNWQDEYRFADPFLLPKGTIIAMRYTFDNSEKNVRNPHHPPRRVVYGPQSSDEMGDLWIQILPRNDEDLMVLARKFMLKELHADVEGYEHALKLNPEDVTAHNYLAVALHSLDRDDAALTHFGEALKIDPDAYDVHYNLAVTLIALGRHEESVGHLRQAIRLQPDSSRAHYGLGVALASMGESDQAIDHFRQALKFDPDAYDVNYNLAVALMVVVRPEEAAGHLRRAITARPDSFEAHNSLGAALASLGKFNEAIDHFRRAVQSNGDLFELRLNLGTALMTLFEFEEAIVHLERAVEIDPDSVTAHHNLAIALGSLHRYPEAIATFRRTLRIEPGNAEAQRGLDIALRLSEENLSQQ